MWLGVPAAAAAAAARRVREAAHPRSKRAAPDGAPVGRRCARRGGPRAPWPAAPRRGLRPLRPAGWRADVLTAGARRGERRRSSPGTPTGGTRAPRGACSACRQSLARVVPAQALCAVRPAVAARGICCSWRPGPPANSVSPHHATGVLRAGNLQVRSRPTSCCSCSARSRVIQSPASPCTRLRTPALANPGDKRAARRRHSRPCARHSPFCGHTRLTCQHSLCARGGAAPCPASADAQQPHGDRPAPRAVQQRRAAQQAHAAGLARAGARFGRGLSARRSALPAPAAPWRRFQPVA